MTRITRGRPDHDHSALGIRQGMAEDGGRVSKKCPMVEAITYALKQWEAFCTYTTDGDLAIDNNAEEDELTDTVFGISAAVRLHDHANPPFGPTKAR